jgi:hypothetical protein
MSGTVRTIPYLLGTSFVTGQSAGIGSDDMRDYVATVDALFVHRAGDASLTGGFTQNYNVTWSGGVTDGFSGVAFNTVATGTSSAGNGVLLNSVYSLDTVQYTNTQAVNGLSIWQDYGGGATEGSRQGLQIRLNQIGATTTWASRSAQPYLVGAQIYNDVAFNEGGTSGTANGIGHVVGFSCWPRLKTGATFFNDLNGMEINLSAQTGSSMLQKIGISIVKTNDDAVSGSLGADVAIIICDQISTTATWAYGILFGNDASQWSIASTGTLLGAQETQNPTSSLQATVAYGVDWKRVKFTSGAWRSMGALIDGGGNFTGQSLALKGWTVTGSSTSLTIDYAMQVVTAAAVASGGSNWTVGDRATTPDGTILEVATLSGSAAATVTILVPGTSASPPGNPVTVTATNGTVFRATVTAFTVNLTWAAANTLSLAPNGVTAIGGAQTNLVRVVTAAGGITVNATDRIVVANKASGAATAVTLPSSPATGRYLTIKDGKGDANVNNITISPAAGNIDGAATRVISTAFGTVDLVYNGTQWNVI